MYNSIIYQLLSTMQYDYVHDILGEVGIAKRLQTFRLSTKNTILNDNHFQPNR